MNIKRSYICDIFASGVSCRIGYYAEYISLFVRVITLKILLILLWKTSKNRLHQRKLSRTSFVTSLHHVSAQACYNQMEARVLQIIATHKSRSRTPGPHAHRWRQVFRPFSFFAAMLPCLVGVFPTVCIGCFSSWPHFSLQSEGWRSTLSPQQRNRIVWTRLAWGKLLQGQRLRQRRQKERSWNECRPRGFTIQGSPMRQMTSLHQLALTSVHWRASLVARPYMAVA